MKVLEITPQYERKHKSYPEVFNAINSIMALNRYLRVNKSMSQVINGLPLEVKKLIKSGKKIKRTQKIRGLNPCQIIVDDFNLITKKSNQLTKK